MNSIKKMLKEVLFGFAPLYFFRQADSGFPRLVYDVKQIYTDEPYNKFIVTCNLYDRNTTDEIDSIADEINEQIGLAIIEHEKNYYKFYKSDNRQYIDETDKSIKRIMFTLELREYKRKDEK